MKQLHLRRGLSLAVTIAMLLTGCSLGGDSSVPEATQTAAAVPTASAAVAAPQTTASPVEQTGYGYTDSEQELQNVTFEKLVLLGGAPWLVTQKEDGSCQAEALESGETAALSSIEGSLLGACGGADSLWYCIEQEDGVLLRQLDAQGEPTEIEDITLGQTYPMDMALDELAESLCAVRRSNPGVQQQREKCIQSEAVRWHGNPTGRTGKWSDCFDQLNGRLRSCGTAAEHRIHR